MHALVLSPYVDRARFDAVAAELDAGRRDFDSGYERGVSDMRGSARWEAHSLALRLPRASLLDLARRYLCTDLGECATERLWPTVRAMRDGDLAALFADLFTHAAERDL